MLYYDELLDTASHLVDIVFENVTDKAGEPYALHPKRVASRLSERDEKLVALLHDTIEDTCLTAEDLISIGFPRNVVDAVMVITIRENESYDEYIDRVIGSNNVLSLKVKKADMEDNQSEDRLNMLSETDRVHLTNKYRNNYKKVVSSLERI